MKPDNKQKPTMGGQGGQGGHAGQAGGLGNSQFNKGNPQKNINQPGMGKNPQASHGQQGGQPNKQRDEKK